MFKKGENFLTSKVNIGLIKDVSTLSEYILYIHMVVIYVKSEMHAAYVDKYFIVSG